MNQYIISFVLMFILLPSCSITKNNKEQEMGSIILSQITSDISITYKKDGTFVNYTCNTKMTEQQIKKNYNAITQKCIEKITQLFENSQSRKNLKSQMLETLRTVSTDNDTDDLQQIVTNLLLSMITKSSTKFKNASIKKNNHVRNTTVSISFSY